MGKSMEDRIDELESQVDKLARSHEVMEKFISKVDGLLSAFQALQGAWRVLEFIGKLAKPLAFLGAVCAAIGVYFSKLKS
jgi:hypothetical protein